MNLEAVQYDYLSEVAATKKVASKVLDIKKSAGRNRTIELSQIEQVEYLDKCVSVDKLKGVDASKLRNTVIFGDTFEALKKLPNDFIDLLIVDPPYNLSKEYGETNFKSMNSNDYVEFTRNWLQGIKRCLKKTASVYVCCDWKSSLIIGSVLQEFFNVQNRITWQREKGRGAKANWKNSMEDIWFATVDKSDFIFNLDDVKMRRKVIAPYKQDGKPKDWIESSSGNFRDTCPSNFWDDISIPYWSMPENTSHPTQKPEKLIAKMILASSNKGDIVFDPFLGSGTTAVVASKLERNFCGIEKEKEYCAVAQKRLEMAEKDKEIQGYCDGVFWERNTLAEQNKLKKSKGHNANDNFGNPKRKNKSQFEKNLLLKLQSSEEFSNL